MLERNERHLYDDTLRGQRDKQPSPCLSWLETLCCPQADVLLNNSANVKDVWKFLGSDG